jgi:hypothetical protein
MLLVNLHLQPLYYKSKKITAEYIPNKLKEREKLHNSSVFKSS